MNVVLNHRLPAIQISETEFKYLTGVELVGIIESKNLELDDLKYKVDQLTNENQELKAKLTASESKVKVKKGKTDDVDNV